MELVSVSLPGGGSVDALRFQDLPAEHIISFMGMPPGFKEQMGIKLFALAAGTNGERALSGLTYGELEHVMSEWFMLSVESEEEDQDGTGSGLDWDHLLL